MTTDDIYKFQFQYGAIKSQLDSAQSPAQIRFNSNMVRLKGSVKVVSVLSRSVSIPIWCD